MSEWSLPAYVSLVHEWAVSQVISISMHAVERGDRGSRNHQEARSTKGKIEKCYVLCLRMHCNLHSQCVNKKTMFVQKTTHVSNSSFQTEDSGQSKTSFEVHVTHLNRFEDRSLRHELGQNLVRFFPPFITDYRICAPVYLST